nr:PREDICTED: gamma-glutamyltranspeptidase 1-like isoform X2 [Bemisia tabaci]
MGCIASLPVPKVMSRRRKYSRILTGKESSSRRKMRSPGLVWTVILVLVIFSLFVSVLYYRSSSEDEATILPDPDHEQSPSPTPMGTFKEAAVVTNAAVCAPVARNILKRGGNAIDGIIAAAVCDGVVFPQNTGLGGGFVMVYYNKAENKVYSVNAREMAPGAATEDMFHGDKDISQRGGLSIAVPGELKGFWEIHKKFGKLNWSELFNETINYCRNGFPVTKYLAEHARNYAPKYEKFTLLKEMLTNPETGKLYEEGELMRRSKLADTLEIFQKEGGDALYTGSLSQCFLQDLKNAGSIITADDLAKYTVHIQETPTYASLKDNMTVYGVPLPASGPIATYILSILDALLPGEDLPTDFTKIAEAFKFGYGRRSEFGDPEFVDVKNILSRMNDPKHIEEVRKHILKMETSQDPVFYGGNFSFVEDHGTGNMVVLDPNGDAVVMTSTVNLIFGSFVVSPCTGIVLNDEMDDFSSPSIINYFTLPPSPANFIRPYKRPMSSMSPLIVLDKNRDVRLAAGSAGGSKITTATSLVTILNLWYNKTIKEAVDYRRIHHQLYPMHVSYEFGLMRSIVEAMKKAGHKLDRLTDGSHFGTAVTALAKKDGLITTSFDFRRVGGWAGF